MRDVTFTRSDTGEERTIKIRPLKRKEIRGLKEQGYTYVGCVPKMETLDETVDKALEIILSTKDQEFLDECDTKEFRRCWKELLAETYGSKDEEKNSPDTTDGTSTETGSTTAGSVAPTSKE